MPICRKYRPKEKTYEQTKINKLGFCRNLCLFDWLKLLNDINPCENLN